MRLLRQTGSLSRNDKRFEWLQNIFRILCFGFVLFLILSGCAGTDWEKKFIRKRVKPPKPAQFAIEETQRPYPDLYREHFIFWRNWHKQLVQDLGGNNKRVLDDIEQTRRHLIYLEKYLQEEKAREVRPLVENFDRETKELFGNRLSITNYGMLTNRLEALGNRIESKLHYKKVKDFLLPTPLPLDMDQYQGEEPVLPAPEIKPSESLADKPKDGIGELTYENYRTRSIQ